ncbi:hypothetical protein [Photorhabdus heterorhabditis]|uniref:Insecticidal toxin complex protein tccz n=1 Tax=Photorhabdus heterorhabditis TaxID=880156 RepID=A0A5B0X2M4_9GAMM|nr:hypothetical protein [Photorhabdus heterorhabditis]KAA1193624.1 hypothetical protein F0L16_07360 [Photorhabdus heterorhabditis]KOY63769.1 hypothetical protein AM629_01345 [Photorhabdus heterorhabditis]MBS9440719.1 hypothetical protein [Photorhabdus heterorhabditis]
MKNLFVIMMFLSAIAGCSDKNNRNNLIQTKEGLKFEFSSGDKFVLTQACTDQIDYLGAHDGMDNELSVVMKKDKQCFPKFNALITKNIGTKMTVSFNGIPMYTTTIQTALSPSFRMGANDKKQAMSIVNTLKN